ncbi:MAG: FAD-dependent thymidylate synthase [Isosphaeraceae bacterium]|nr:FAD-dependent thymidylate synthase [Isosphaeraceae bacterium]
MDDSVDIEVVWTPQVYLLSRQTIDEAELSRFLEEEGAETWQTDTLVAAEKLVEVAGRLCYQSYARPRPGGNAAYINHILESGHGSVLEHAVFTLLITGVSRSLTHELIRHRAGWAYSQRSQRYVDESRAAFVVPPAIAEDLELYLLWWEAVQAGQRAYQQLAERLMEKLSHVEDRTLRRKRAREAARSVLPNATATEICVTANARALRHFIELRGHSAADAEIRQLALAILGRLQAECPHLFGDYQVVKAPDGSPEVRTPFRKV